MTARLSSRKGKKLRTGARRYSIVASRNLNDNSTGRPCLASPAVHCLATFPRIAFPSYDLFTGKIRPTIRAAAQFREARQDWAALDLEILKERNPRT